MATAQPCTSCSRRTSPRCDAGRADVFRARRARWPTRPTSCRRGAGPDPAPARRLRAPGAQRAGRPTCVEPSTTASTMNSADRAARPRHGARRGTCRRASVAPSTRPWRSRPRIGTGPRSGGFVPATVASSWRAWTRVLAGSSPRADDQPAACGHGARRAAPGRWSDRPWRWRVRDVLDARPPAAGRLRRAGDGAPALRGAVEALIDGHPIAWDLAGACGRTPVEQEMTRQIRALAAIAAVQVHASRPAGGRLRALDCWRARACRPRALSALAAFHRTDAVCLAALAAEVHRARSPRESRPRS